MTENFGFGRRFVEEAAENAEEMAKIEEIRAKTKEALTKVIGQYDLETYLKDQLVFNETLEGLSSRRFNILAGNLLVDIDDITKTARSKGPNLFTTYLSKLHRIYTEGINIESLPDYNTEQAEFFEYLSEFSMETVDTFDELDYGYTMAAFRSLVYLAFIVEYQNIREAVLTTNDKDNVAEKNADLSASKITKDGNVVTKKSILPSLQ